MKVCTKCKVSKPLYQFGIDKTKKSGRRPFCTDCKRRLDKAYERNRKKKQVVDPEIARAWRVGKRVRKRYWANNNHHWSYRPEHIKDVIELRPAVHRLAHSFLAYDKKSMLFKTKDGQLLDTKEKHYRYIIRQIRLFKNQHLFTVQVSKHVIHQYNPATIPGQQPQIEPLQTQAIAA